VRHGENHQFALPIDIEPMEAKSATKLPQGGGWQFEPKWDGFRCLAFKEGGTVDLRAKSGKPLGRYFPEVVSLLQNLPIERFVIDGELVIERDGRLSFETLQMRLHPAASRIKKLSTMTPAKFVVFDILATADGSSKKDEALKRRRELLETLLGRYADPGKLVLSPFTRKHHKAEQWLSSAGGDGLDGVICKRIDQPYADGARAMVKVKRLRTADCVIGGFRYESRSHQVGSLLLGLYNKEGKLDHVGFTSAIYNRDRPQLTRRLEAIRQAPGFTGKKPGGPSRWNAERSSEWEPVRPELVVEVRFDHVTGCRFRHGTSFIRWRPDKKPRQCDYEQIEQAAMVDLTI